MDTIDSYRDKLRVLPYSFTEFGANCIVFTEVITLTAQITINER